MKRSGRKLSNMVLVCLAALVIFSLNGCSKKTAKVGENGKALTRFDVPWTTTGIGNPLLAIAIDQKYFEEEGLDVILNPLNTSGNVDQLMAVSTGKIDLAFGSGTTAPLLFIEQGNDLVIVGGVMGEGAALITRPENQAQYANFTKDSLNGKRIGAIRANTGDVALRGWLSRQGADLSKITFVELDSAATILEAVRKGELDVGNIFVNWRVVAEEQGLPVVLHVDDLTSNFPCCRLSTTKKNIEKRREDYVAFFRALIRAYKVYTFEHEKTLDIADKFYDADRGLKQNQYYDYGHYNLNPDPGKKPVQTFYDGMVSVGYAKGGADIASHVDASIYGDALNQILKDYPNDPFYQGVKKHFDENN
ncbi:MAG: ABC transporter substrate-binding protein [Treponema sp.]|jgi:NitT/TauT family transport system substrate-binding protein|nr:ABC transporter substrate-binding protein [Treponema sp.]